MWGVEIQMYRKRWILQNRANTGYLSNQKEENNWYLK